MSRYQHTQSYGGPPNTHPPHVNANSSNVNRQTGNTNKYEKAPPVSRILHLTKHTHTHNSLSITIEIELFSVENVFTSHLFLMSFHPIFYPLTANEFE